MERSEHWEKLWASRGEVPRLRGVLEKNLASHAWGQLCRELFPDPATLAGRRTIELGSGVGGMSLPLALAGAEVHLLDQSESALERARVAWDALGLPVHIHQADLLDLPEELLEGFDLSHSWGVAEHFAGEEREAVIAAHVRVLRPGGHTAISVPNAWCPFYRLNKALQELAGTWEWGYEDPFSRGELLRLSREAGLEACRLLGSRLGDDFRVWTWRPLRRALGSLVPEALKRSLRRRPATPEPEEEEPGELPPLRAPEVREGSLDAWLGYALLLIGERRASPPPPAAG